jgi:hypothetical protein
MFPLLRFIFLLFREKTPALRRCFYLRVKGIYTVKDVFAGKNQGTMIFYIYADRVCFYGDYL